MKLVTKPTRNFCWLNYLGNILRVTGDLVFIPDHVFYQEPFARRLEVNFLATRKWSPCLQTRGREVLFLKKLLHHNEHCGANGGFKYKFRAGFR